jgi:hypothetical protein
MGLTLDIDGKEVEGRKETLRRLWRYRRVDHIPVGVWCDDFSRYSMREQCEDGRLQVEIMTGNLQKCWRAFPDDYIPHVRVWPGYMTVASMFGMETFWSDDPNQPPGVRGHLIRDISRVYALPRPDPRGDGLMPHNLKWLGHCREIFPETVSFTGIDLGGPINTAKDLLEANLLYTAFLDAPREMHHLLALAADVQIGCYREIVRAAGGESRLTCVDCDPVWAPEGLKGFVSDDVCSSFGPRVFEAFSMPYNNRLFREFGGGRLHNCGPHPSAGLYLRHEPVCAGLNCSFAYSRAGFPVLKEAFRQKGIVEINFDNGETPEQVIEGYRNSAEALAPAVAAIPVLLINETWSVDDIRETYLRLRRISEAYAAEIDWACDG